METELLPNQDQSDINDLIARRIGDIYKVNGGLAQFFERLQQERTTQPSTETEHSLETCIMKAVKCAKAPGRGNS
jgi:hypothetical protein